MIEIKINEGCETMSKKIILKFNFNAFLTFGYKPHSFEDF